jgi:hypothetical protein
LRTVLQIRDPLVKNIGDRNNPACMTEDVAIFDSFNSILTALPGAYAPGFMLPPASPAKARS